MMNLAALAYVSTAVRRLSAAELDALLLTARTANEGEQVTGALLHHDGSFFQYIEGSTEGLNHIYDRIKRASQHKGLIELFYLQIENRHFADWHMGFAEAPRTLLQQLANSRWKDAVSSLAHHESPSTGLALLLNFWSRTEPRRL
jgi:hypothetical protein